MRHRWIEAEDRTIARYIVLFDKPAAFRRFAEDFFISEKAVASRYYRNRAYIDIMANDLKDYESIVTPPKKWYKRLWKSVKSMLNISKFI